MYDATDDPYTYENSTVLVSKLDLRDQGELDDFEAEITNARAAAKTRRAAAPRLQKSDTASCRLLTPCPVRQFRP
jgi:fido (protein-threonine AMPylation protein)